MNKDSQHLIVFTKNPVKGEVKTRLAKSIGDSNALVIHNALTQKTVEVLNTVKAFKSVYFSKEEERNSVWKNACQSVDVQKGKDLGARMFHAFQDSFYKGFEKTLIIGSDLWDLTLEDIEKGFKALDKNDLVIGPAKDGGYYLIGMKIPHKELFESIHWGGNQVLKDTLKKCRDKKIKLLNEKNDIDLWEDLEPIEALKKLI